MRVIETPPAILQAAFDHVLSGMSMPRAARRAGMSYELLRRIGPRSEATIRADLESQFAEITHRWDNDLIEARRIDPL